MEPKRKSVEVEMGDLDHESTAMLPDGNHTLPSAKGDAGDTGSVTHKNPDTDSLDNNNTDKLKYTTTWRDAWLQFCTETSFHGLKQITEPQPFILRRLVWLVLVLVGTALFLYQMITGIIYFRAYPVTVNVKINHNDSIVFPAITICNQNAFRKTAAARYGLYEVLSDMFTESDSDPAAILARHGNASEISLHEIAEKTAHTKEDMIVSCRWDSLPCSLDDFVTTYTDYGICYTYNSGRNGRTLQATRTGTEGGLRLLLNLEQYEYMVGPNTGAGLRVLVHTQQEAPLVKEFGVAVPPGTQSFLGMTLIRVDNLPDPHGQCDPDLTLKYHDQYTKSNCIKELRQSYIQGQCGCRHIDMADNDDDRFNQEIDLSKCPVPCIVDSHELFNSIGYISNFDALNLLNSNLTDKLKTKFADAQEVTQRVNKDIVRHDQSMVRDILDNIQSLEDFFGNVTHDVQEIHDEITELFDELELRLRFHKTRALDGVKYIMEHDFVRGWMILEERTLPFLTVNCFELRFSFLNALEKLESDPDKELLTLAQWNNVENRFKERLDVAVRVRDNVTEVHEKYKTGKPLLTFKMTLNRRYDLSFITVELLQAHIKGNNQDEFYRHIFSAYEMFVEACETFIEMGQNATQSISPDSDMLQQTFKRFRDGCVKYNYNIFLYKTRVVDGPVIVIDQRIEEFALLNRTLDQAKQELLRVIESIKGPIEDLREGSWGLITEAMTKATDYLTTSSQLKIDLARYMTSPQVKEAVQDIQHVFDELRLYGRELNEKLNNVKLELYNMWENLLSEYTTRKFYGKVNADFNINRNSNTTFYYRYFADLLNMKVEEVMALDPEKLEYMLNADLVDISTFGKMTEIKQKFIRLQTKANIGERLGSMDEDFSHSVSDFQDSLSHFRSDIQVDTSFYLTNFLRLDAYMQQLSYEEIIQQPAYELLNLLGDIGGSVGLFLGASAMSLAEVLDVLFLQASRLVVR